MVVGVCGGSKGSELKKLEQNKISETGTDVASR